jgi:hypothetical protein
MRMYQKEGTGQTRLNSLHEGKTADYKSTGEDCCQTRQRVCNSKSAAHLATLARSSQHAGDRLLTIRGSQDGGVNCGGAMQFRVRCGRKSSSRARIGFGQ